MSRSSGSNGTPSSRWLGALSGRHTDLAEKWSNKGLRNLLIAFGLANVAEWGFITAFSVHAFDVGGTLAVGLLGIRMFAGAASTTMIAPRFEESRRALTAITFSRTVLLVGSAVLAMSGAAFGFTLALVVLDAVVAAGYRPVHQSLLPALANSPAELMRAVAGTSTTKTVGQGLGAVVCGFAINWTSPATVMLVLGLLMGGPFLCSLAIVRVVGLRLTRARRPFHEALIAFPQVLRDSQAWPLVSAGVLRTLLRGVWNSLLVVVALHLFDLRNSGVGVFQAAASLGAVLALPVTAAQIGRQRLAFPCGVAFLVAGLAVAGIGGAHLAVFGLALICVWGTAMAVADAMSMSMLHRMFHPDVLRRTVSVMESLKLVSEGVGALAAPALVSLFGLRLALVVAGLPLPALVLLTWARLRRTDALAEGRSHMVTRLHGVALFRGSNMESIEELAASVVPMDADPETEIITQGDPGDRFYVIDSGEVEVLIDAYPIGHIGPGRGFGERALLRSTRRSATVRAIAPTHLYAIDRARFLSVVTGTDAGAAPENEPALQPVQRNVAALPLTELLGELTPLAGLDAVGLASLALLANRRRHSSHELIFAEGDQSDAIHLVLEGRAEVSIAERVVAVLLPGDYFGEIGVLHQTTRTSSVRALEDLHLVSLPAASVLEAIDAAGSTPTHHLLRHADTV